MQRIIYLLFFLSYLNILTVIPGSCAAMAPKTVLCDQVRIGENAFDEYESIWEILLTEVLEQKDVQYQADDFPVSAHLFPQSEQQRMVKFQIVEPFCFTYRTTVETNTLTPDSLFAYNSKNAFAQYYDYLFRLTPF